MPPGGVSAVGRGSSRSHQEPQEQTVLSVPAQALQPVLPLPCTSTPQGAAAAL